MLVSFWSTHHGQSGVTTNMAALSLAISLKYGFRVLVTHTQYGETSLERTLVSNIDEYIGGTLSNYGLEPALRLEKNGLLNEDNFSDYTIPLIKGNGYDLLVGTRNKDLGAAEQKNYEDTMIRVLEMARRKYDLTFVDLAGGMMNELSKRVLMKSDIIVVNINQSSYTLDRLKQADFESIKGDVKLIYCIGRYDERIKSNQKNISKKYRLKNVIAVPYYAQLIDVMNRGEMVEFFGRNIVDKKRRQDDFFKCLLKSSEKIVKQMDG